MPELWTVAHKVRAGLRPKAHREMLAALDRGPAPTSAAELEAALAALAEVVGAPGAAALPGVRRPGGGVVLPARRIVLAAQHLRAEEPAGQESVAKACADVSPTLGAYLLALLSTGRGSNAVAGLASTVSSHAREVSWLHRHLGVLDGAPGPAEFDDDDGAELRLRQLSPVTCGPTAVILLRALLDPAYALWLTTGIHIEPDRAADFLPFGERFRSQQQRVHESLTRHALGPMAWPRLLGSPPWALAAFLNRFTSLTGASCAWVPVDPADEALVLRCLDAVQAGVHAGIPVPMYVGRHVDRHVVLAIAATSTGIRLYDPASGTVLDVETADIVRGRIGVAGWDTLEGVIVPVV
ncbi:MAG: hypothetical protein ACT4P1_03380 [Sporichthyaceae bacterium]